MRGWRAHLIGWAAAIGLILLVGWLDMVISGPVPR